MHTVKNLLSSFGAISKQKIHTIILKGFSNALPFPPTYLCEARFFSYTFTQTTYCDRLNAEACMRTLMCSVRPDTRDLQKCQTMLLFSLIFFEKLFFKKRYLLTCNYFGILLNIFSILISIVVNIGR